MQALGFVGEMALLLNCNRANARGRRRIARSSRRAAAREPWHVATVGTEGCVERRLARRYQEGERLAEGERLGRPTGPGRETRRAGGHAQISRAPKENRP